MYSFLYFVYFMMMRARARAGARGRSFPGWAQKILDHVEWYYNVPYLKKIRKSGRNEPGVTKTKRKQRVIASLTSYPARVPTLWISIDSIMRQRVRADEIILWLARDQFEKGIDSLPEEIRNLQERGLTIRFCDDLKSHKKYFYALQEYDKDLVILFDDDIFYPRDTVGKLLELHERYPEDICCMTAQVMHPAFTAPPSEWRNPRMDEKWLHSEEIQAFTGSGTLIPPGCLPEETFDSEKIRTFCPFADDLWLAFMARRKGTRTSSVYPWRAFPVMIYGTGKDSLYRINAEQGKNDQQWKALLDFYTLHGKTNL